MKKLIFGGLFLGLIAIGFVGCKKEFSSDNVVKGKTEINEDIIVNKDILSFKTFEAYEKFVGMEADVDREQILKAIKNSGFKNYLDSKSTELIAKSEENSDSLYDDSTEDNDDMDEFFGQLLNKDGAIFIDNYLFKLDFLNKNVYAIKTNMVDNNYKTLINKLNNLGQDVLIFSFDDDVIDLINNSDGFIGKAGKSCSGSNVNKQEWVQYYDNNAKGSKRIRYRCKLRLRYTNLGIYHWLTTKFTHQKKKGGGAWLNDYNSFSIGYEVTYYNNAGGQYGNITHYPPNNINHLEYWAKTKTITHYRGPKCLRQFDLKAWAFYLDKGDTYQVLGIGGPNYRIVNI